jgi:hypothetical protein
LKGEKKMNIINKHSVLREVRENGQWNGYIAPNNVNHMNINKGWHLGMDITIVKGCKEFPNDYIVLTENENDKNYKLEEFLENFKHWNCNSELGNRIRFWK